MTTFKIGKKRNSCSEHTLQVQCISYFKIHNPSKLIYAIPNGGLRNKFEAIKLKKEGVLAGIPDICIPHQSSCNRYNALYIEFKARLGRLSASQRHIIPYLEKAGNKVVVIRTFEEFRDTIKNYLNIR